ncbi:MAG: hypothetical protein WB660_28710 [Candidatus Sulfotelmatobacter sp.]
MALIPAASTILAKSKCLKSGAIVGNAGHHHFEFHHAQRAVVENNNLHGLIVLSQGQEIAHEHGESTIAAEGYDLPVWL